MANLIAIEEIQDRMILAEPIVNNYGHTLIPAGAILKEQHKKLLKTWNIRVVVIKTEDNEEEKEISQEMQLLAIARLKKRLNWRPRNAIEYDLYETGIIQAAKLCTRKIKDI